MQDRDDGGMPDPGMYQGQKSLDGLRHGVGRYVYPMAYFKKEEVAETQKPSDYGFPDAYFTYEGEWVNNKKHGRGRFVLGDGSIYEGEFKEGEIEGEGTRTWTNGAIYVGQFRLGEKAGQGKYVGAKFKDGTTYVGSWERNKRHGRGVLTGKDGAVYDGEFVEHDQTGRGILTRTNGASYEGVWLKGERHGEGVMQWPSGTVYKGEWQHNSFEGQGSLLAKFGDEPDRTYTGVFREGQPTTQAVKLDFQMPEPLPAEDLQLPPAEAAPPKGAPPPKGDKGRPASREKPGAKGGGDLGSRPDSPSEPEWVLVAGEAARPFSVICKDAEGSVANYESGRIVTVSLQQLAQKEAADKKKGGKKTPEPDEKEEPAEVLSSVELAQAPTVEGVATFEGVVVPEDITPTSYEGEYVLTFTDATPGEHPLLTFQPIPEEGAASAPVRVEQGEALEMH